jgi:hypothetical protein
MILICQFLGRFRALDRFIKSSHPGSSASRNIPQSTATSRTSTEVSSYLLLTNA